MNYEDIEYYIIKCMEDEQYKWRTITGISKELGIDQDDVKSTLRDLGEKHLLVSPCYLSEDGQRLYTTREYYKKTRGFLIKLLCAITGRIV